MAQAPDHSAELALLGCVLLNAAVFGSAWRFASRRMTASRSQAALDAVLLGYLAQYAAIGLPGMAGLLRPATVVATATIAAAALWVAAGRRRPPPASPVPPAAVALGAFATAVIVGFAWFQADLPVLNNDALTYHFPAAVQWLQRGRIDVFPTWFFNPANGYSPLAGSTFTAWLMVPFGSDVVARFVQVPALLALGLGTYRLGRQLSAGPLAAAAVAVAVVLCRPLFTAALMGKDDLFVAFTFVAAVVALAPDRAREPFGPVRLGAAVGLLLAMKYTALLAVPLLLLAGDGPIRAGWRAGRWMTAAAVAVALAGPWYLRNWVATGNPLFPLAVPHLFRGLFTVSRSLAFSSVRSDLGIVVGGSYGVPLAVCGIAGAAWAVAIARGGWRPVADPLSRACLVGPPLALFLFFWRSPFPEVRFLFPAIVLFLSAVGPATAGFGWASLALTIASVATVSVSAGWSLFGRLVPVAAVVAAVVAIADTATRGRPWPRRLAWAVPVGGVGLLAYVGWAGFCRSYADQWTAGPAWPAVYRDDGPLWQAINRLVPPDATVAYADLYLVYPLQGPALRRRLVYVPTRHGVRTPADLPYLGGHLSGEQLVTTATAATVADPNPAAWRDGLRRVGAGFLVVGRTAGGPEAAWAKADPTHFRPMYAGPGGWVFAVVP